MDHPFARGEKVYDVTFENVQAGLRTDYLFRLANQRGGIVLGTGDLSELALGWSHVRRRRPDVALQRQRRGAEDADPAPDPLGDLVGTVRRLRSTRCCSRSSTPRSPRSWCPGRGRGAAEQRGKGRPVRAAGLHAVLHAALRVPAVEDRVPGLARLARRRARRWPPGSRRTSDRPTRSTEIRQWLRVFVQRFFAFSQFKRSAMPNGPKVSAGGSLSPRGDWRAPSDMSARIWLDEIEREVPAD